MNDAPAQLQYGVPQPTFWQRRGMRWALILVGLLATGAVLLVVNGRSVRLFVDGKRRLWDERRRYYETAAETMPADHLIFDAPMDRILADAPVDPPGRWELLWSKRRTAATTRSSREPLVFQHTMTTASGTKVLVAVQFELSSPQRQLIATMLKPGTLKVRPLPYGPFVVFIDDGTFTKPLRLYAGEIDPNDDRHFTIRYENSRGSGVLDGRMVDDPGNTPAYAEFGTIRMTRIPDAGGQAIKRGQ